MQVIIFGAVAGFLMFGLKAAWNSNKFAKWLIILLALPIVVFFVMVFSQMAFSAEPQTSCETMSMETGELVFKKVPCSSMETPMPCSKEWTDSEGSWHSEYRPCKPGEQKTVEQIDREEAAVQKKQCRKDYQALRIGMTLDRFEQCTDGLVYITDTVVKGAVVESYRSTFYFIYAKNGRIIAYTRRTN